MDVLKDLVSLNLGNLPVWVNSLLVVGAVLVVGRGADRVVMSAARMARKLGISELIIGLTVVAFGTSAPEFAVTLISAVRGMGNISVGNIVGSNVFNMGFILGGAALVKSVPVTRMLVTRDTLVLCGAGLALVLLVGQDLHLGRVEGAILFGGLIVYLTILFRQRAQGIDEDPSMEFEPGAGGGLGAGALGLLLGLGLVTAGSHLLVESASAVARSLGLSEWVIGVTVVAVGTSAPELATTIAALTRGRYAISAGNLVGSDIFNLLGVLGLTGMLHPVTVDPLARISLVGLLGMVLLALLLMRTGWRISRFEGGILVLVAATRWVLDVALRTAG